MAFLEISDNANPFATGAHVYFQGTVGAGQEIFADATKNFFTHDTVSVSAVFNQTAGAKLYAFVFNTEAAFQAGAGPLQTIAYNTRGSQEMHLGDQIGSLKLVGYVGTRDGYLASN